MKYYEMSQSVWITMCNTYDPNNKMTVARLDDFLFEKFGIAVQASGSLSYAIINESKFVQFQLLHG